MPIYKLSDELWFPGPEEFEDNLVAMGGDLSVSRLLLAYSKGIFPWYDEPGNPHWYCPEERCMFHVPSFKPSKSLRNVRNQGIYKCTFDLGFEVVLDGCSSGDRVDATWILPEVMEAYTELHKLGFAHSVEVWRRNEELGLGTIVGGLYGVSIGGMFFGESMFSHEPNTSKLALWFLVERCKEWGIEWIDAQVPNDHLFSMGAEVIPRETFLQHLEEALKMPTHRGVWK